MSSLFPVSWTNTLADDGPQNFTMGTVMVALVAGTITHYRMWRVSAENSGTWTLQIFGPSSVLTSQTYTHTAGANAWIEVPLTTPLAVTAGQKFLVAKHCGDAAYGAASGYFTSAVTNSANELTGPATATVTAGYFDGSTGNARYNYGGAAGTRPTSTFGGGAYGADVVFAPPAADTTPPSVPANLRVTGTPGESSGDVAWDAATDDVAVTGYELLVSGPL